MMICYMQTTPGKTKSHSSRNRVIPLEEDIRRLFQECKVGRGNASLLSEALTYAKPEDLKSKEIIKVRSNACSPSRPINIWLSPRSSMLAVAPLRSSSPHKSRGRLLRPNARVRLQANRWILRRTLVSPWIGIEIVLRQVQRRRRTSTSPPRRNFLLRS